MNATRVMTERPMNQAQLDTQALYRTPTGRLCMVESIKGSLVNFVYVKIDARGRPAERVEGFSLSSGNLFMLRKVH